MNRHLKSTRPVARKLLIPADSDQVQNEIVAKKQQAKSFFFKKVNREDVGDPCIVYERPYRCGLV